MKGYSRLQAAGILATAAQRLYNYYGSYKSSSNPGSIYQKGSKTLSGNKTNLSQMAYYKKSSFGSKKYGKKKMDWGKKKKKLWKKKKLRKFKKFAKYMEKVDTATQPYSIETSEDQASWVAPTDATEGNSNIHGIDTGLSRTFAAAAGKTGIWNALEDDLYHGYKQTTTAVINRPDTLHYNENFMIEKLLTKICIRNNTNIGCKVEMYYVSRKPNNTTTSEFDSEVLMHRQIIQAMKDSYNPPTNVSIENKQSYIETLYDYPEVCRRFNLKLVKSYIHYPAVTKFFNMSCPFAGYARNTADCFRFTADPRFHRALVFVIKGLPVHSSAAGDFVGGPTSYGNWNFSYLHFS